MSTGKCPCGFSCSSRDGLVEHVEESRHGGAMWAAENGSVLVLNPPTGRAVSLTPAEFAAGGPGHGGFIGPKPTESSTAVPEPALLNVLKEIAVSIKENTTITREAWHAIVTGQQAAPPLNEGDFQEIDLCANDAEDEFIEPHIRLKKLLPVAQERHLTSKEPIALIMGGAIYHIGLKVEDITGIVAKCR